MIWATASGEAALDDGIVNRGFDNGNPVGIALAVPASIHLTDMLHNNALGRNDLQFSTGFPAHDMQLTVALMRTAMKGITDYQTILRW